MPKKPQERRRTTQRAHRSKPTRSVAGRPQSHAGQAIVVRAPGPKPWLLQPEELTILKNAVCKGATDEELKFCLAVARRRKLDPFKGQIWFVPRRDRGADDGEGGTGAKVWIPVVSIGGLCHVGARDHKDYGSFSEPEFGPMVTVEWRWKGQGNPKKLQVPEWARVEAFKKGSAQPTVGKVWWSEIYPNIDYAPMVRQMPRRMLAKCAQAQAIRLAYPETGGLYIQEEMQELGPPQYTDAGREIIEQPKGQTAVASQEEIRKRNDERGREELRNLQKANAAKQPPIDIPAPKGVTRVDGSMQACLFWQYHAESDTYEISGSDVLRKQARDLLEPLWNATAGAILCARDKQSSAQKKLGTLISQLEGRKIPIREFGAKREPGE